MKFYPVKYCGHQLKKAACQYLFAAFIENITFTKKHHEKNHRYFIAVCNDTIRFRATKQQTALWRSTK